MTKLGKFLKKSLSRRSSSSPIVANSNSNISSFDSSSPKSVPVFVGKSRRRYMVNSEILDHPLFRELVERSNAGSHGGVEEVFVECEVVLFEHLLWMLENADPQPESLDELVDFYAC
ncbi:auxin-responsive protein SAUR76-like [Amaranthus tricolor]|uniref:auxin-responsive protein SAUR76-like n=1 Tax=Amaranthus tricolor TaxID=29722 RepID=UPI0025853C25|nr:auxin-responsive protein SAUR76-like [Amaranthus tricolor]